MQARLTIWLPSLEVPNIPRMLGEKKRGLTCILLPRPQAILVSSGDFQDETEATLKCVAERQLNISMGLHSTSET